MKRLLSLAVLLSFGVLLTAGCGTQSGTGTSAAGDKDKIVIGVTNITMKESVYQFMKAAAENKAKELGVEVIWQSSELDPSAQMNQVQNFIAQGVDAIVIEPADPHSAKQQVILAKQAGIPVINLEGLIEGAKTDLRIVGDSVRVGEEQAENFMKEWGDKPANVVILSGTKGDEVAESITKGNLNNIEQHSNLHVVGNQYHTNWDKQLAMNTMENLLVKYKNDIQVVFANNDGMISGAMKAAENAGVKDKIIFYGADNDQSIVEAILKGDPVRTVDKGAMLQGERVVEGAVKLVKGEKLQFDQMIDDIPVWYTPITIVDKDNLEQAKQKYPNLFK
ncbi:sugar ABC transporter substrate-binding protein [Brevibacillus choshinensis]|uniref:sugar ABC transporter substrate-binding protein n=1 Tax=Brevibacillus choshinensis TaxID=54911 RepID=UPI002E238CF9|nr:substrate-binding domain-containing protein [Brevibacillus choshinensis]